MLDLITQNAGTIGLLLFFTFFIGIVIFAFLPSKKKQFQDYGNIPLKENDND